jgi:hypothetical protein
MESMIVSFSLYTDLQTLRSKYEEQLRQAEYMIEKLKSNSYKSDNSREIMEYSLVKDTMSYALKRLDEINI